MFEDDDPFRNRLADFLRTKEISVIALPNSRDTYEQLERAPFHTGIFDVQDANQNDEPVGITLAEKFIEENPEGHALVISAHKKYGENFKDNPKVTFLEKPLTPVTEKQKIILKTISDSYQNSLGEENQFEHSKIEALVEHVSPQNCTLSFKDDETGWMLLDLPHSSYSNEELHDNQKIELIRIKQNNQITYNISPNSELTAQENHPTEEDPLPPPPSDFKNKAQVDAYQKGLSDFFDS